MLTKDLNILEVVAIVTMVVCALATVVCLSQQWWGYAAANAAASFLCRWTLGHAILENFFKE